MQIKGPRNTAQKKKKAEKGGCFLSDSIEFFPDYKWGFNQLLEYAFK